MESKIRIGLLVDYLESEYSDCLIKGITSFCKTKDIALYIFFVGEIKNKENSVISQYNAVISFVNKNNLDGIVIASGGQFHTVTKPEFVSYLRSTFSIPLVNISAKLPQIHSFVVNCNDAFSELITFLIKKQNCKKFGFMGVKSNSDEVEERTRIFEETLKANDIPFSSVVFWQEEFLYSSAFLAIEKYYKANKCIDLDAIICLNDEMAFGCLDFCNQNNISVPQDVIITGFDDSERAAFFSPTLTSVNQGLQEQGFKAGESIYNLILGNEVPLVQEIKAKTILRKSSQKYKETNLERFKNMRVEVDNMDDDAHKSIASEWFLRYSQLRGAASIYANIQDSRELDSLRFKLNDIFKSFGIKSSAVVMYSSPIERKQTDQFFVLPQKAKLISYYDDTKTNVDSKVNNQIIEFNPNDYMIPPNCICETSEGMIVISLFYGDFQFGYVLMQRGMLDRVVYGVIAKSISAQLSSVIDFSKIKEEQEEISKKAVQLNLLAHTDDLTGLKNRRGLIELGQYSLNHHETIQSSGLVIYADMDGLKKINDRYGHEAGDNAIIAQSKILRSNFRRSDILARIAGDEFAIICEGLSVRTFEEIKKTIERDCAKWKEETNSPYDISISLGYIEYPHATARYNITPLLAEADSNLYFEKRRKKELLNK